MNSENTLRTREYARMIGLAKAARLEGEMGMKGIPSASVGRMSGVRLVACAIGMLVLVQSAEGASFDCAKATTKVEKLICGDAELSKLDTDLNEAYRAALNRSKDKERITREQRQWIRERNRCADSACVKSAYERRLASIDVNAGMYVLVLDKDNELCRGMLGLYNSDMRRYRRLKYELHDVFSRIKWRDLEGTDQPLFGTHHRLSTWLRTDLDINNDGKNETVVKISAAHGRIDIDTLLIYDAGSPIWTQANAATEKSRRLLDTPNRMFAPGVHLYFLTQVPQSLRDAMVEYKLGHLPDYLKHVDATANRRDFGKPYIGASFVLQPFIWRGVTYVSITDQDPEWVVIGKYVGGEKVREVCYFYDHTHTYLHF